RSSAPATAATRPEPAADPHTLRVPWWPARAHLDPLRKRRTHTRSHGHLVEAAEPSPPSRAHPSPPPHPSRQTAAPRRRLPPRSAPHKPPALRGKFPRDAGEGSVAKGSTPA